MSSKSFRFLIAAAFVAAAGLSPAANSRKAGFLNVPPESTKSAVSPDGRWALIAGPISDRALLLENRTDGTRKLVRKYERSGTIGWSPGSKAFFFNDAYGSNLEDAYVYFVGKEQPISLNDLVFAYDHGAKTIEADHAYVHAAKWTGADRLLVEYCGHGGSGSGQTFDSMYEVSLQGAPDTEPEIRRISCLVRPSSQTKADCQY